MSEPGTVDWEARRAEKAEAEVEHLRAALDEIKTLTSAASWDNASEMQRSIIANQIWHLADDALREQ